MRGYIAWVLPEIERARLLNIFPARYPDVIAHHVTHQLNASDTDTLPKETSGRIIGMLDDGVGLQTLVVDMGFPRPDGEEYHITWSLDRSLGYKPKDSKKLCRDALSPDFGGSLYSSDVLIELVPSFIPHGGK